MKISKYSWITKKFLEEEHLIKNKSLRTISRELNIPEGTIFFIVKKLNLKNRNRKETNKLLFEKKDITKEVLLDEYIDNNSSIKNIAKMFNVSTATIWKKLKKYSIPTKKQGKCYKVWNKGKSYKFKHPKQFKKGMIPWNKGLTKENDSRILQFSLLKTGKKRPNMSGLNHHFFNKSLSIEHRGKLSLSHGGTGNPYEKSHYPEIWSDKLREKIRKRDKYICQICNTTQEENILLYKRDLEVHHIDYNKKNCGEDNLITLCLHCHRKTNYNREYWKKYFIEYFNVKKEN